MEIDQSIAIMNNQTNPAILPATEEPLDYIPLRILPGTIKWIRPVHDADPQVKVRTKDGQWKWEYKSKNAPNALLTVFKWESEGWPRFGIISTQRLDDIIQSLKTVADLYPNIPIPTTPSDAITILHATNHVSWSDYSSRILNPNAVL